MHLYGCLVIDLVFVGQPGWPDNRVVKAVCLDDVGDTSERLQILANCATVPFAERKAVYRCQSAAGSLLLADPARQLSVGSIKTDYPFPSVLTGRKPPGRWSRRPMNDSLDSLAPKPAEQRSNQARPGNSIFKPSTTIPTAMAARIIPIRRVIMTRIRAESSLPIEVEK